MEAKDLRVRARANLQGNWPLSIGVAAVAALLKGLTVGSSFLPDINTDVPDFLSGSAVISNILKAGVTLGKLRISIPGGLLSLVAFILGGTIQLGYAQFLLKQHDGGKPEFSELFSQFQRFGTGFAQGFLRELYTSLWLLLLVVPGIIKSYSYAMTPFILAENPDLSASEAIRRSMELMDGHKLELFYLDLTFIGWNILAAITLNLGYLAVNPYKNAARAAFYRQLTAPRGTTTVEF